MSDIFMPVGPNKLVGPAAAQVGGSERGKQVPPWRRDWMRASFGGAQFHCESNARESGRRIVEHQFPKKELPYAEDMGRSAREFTIRGYCIVYPSDVDDLFQRDYRNPRNRLIKALEQDGPGKLQLPTQPEQIVVCTKYRMQEEEKFGGYCIFDMTFAEYGLDPLYDPASSDTVTAIADSAGAVRGQVQQQLAPPPASPPAAPIVTGA
jgi:prophage DNA circulation protein